MRMFNHDNEVRTNSVPVAAMLIANGFEVLKSFPSNRPNVRVYVFSPAARVSS